MPTAPHIIIQTRFVAFHCWPNAPEHLGWLRHVHRHEFHVKMECPVEHDDRDIEFCQLKSWLDAEIGATAPRCYNPEWETCIPAQRPVSLNWSCEMWAKYILSKFDIATRCEVLEDGENGGYATTPFDVVQGKKMARAQIEKFRGESLRDHPNLQDVAGLTNYPNIGDNEAYATYFQTDQIDWERSEAELTARKKSRTPEESPRTITYCGRPGVSSIRPSDSISEEELLRISTILSQWDKKPHNQSEYPSDCLVAITLIALRDASECQTGDLYDPKKCVDVSEYITRADKILFNEIDWQQTGG